MSLPDLQLVKSYLRIPAINTDEDALIDVLLANAKAIAEHYIERAIDPTAITFYDSAETVRAYPVITQLLSPQWPVDPVIGAVVVDADGVTVDPTTYRLDGPSGRIIANEGETFDNGPYRITLTAGLATDPAYATKIEPTLAQIILDITSELYSNRTPGTTYESAGAGVAVSRVDRAAIPPRTQMLLDRLKAVPIA